MKKVVLSLSLLLMLLSTFVLPDLAMAKTLSVPPAATVISSAWANADGYVLTKGAYYQEITTAHKYFIVYEGEGGSYKGAYLYPGRWGFVYGFNDAPGWYKLWHKKTQ